MKKEYRIIASDLDGTLLNSNGCVSSENLQAIQELTERGVLFVPSSGRTLEEIPLFVRSIPSVRYVIHSDGAVVFDKRTGAYIDMSMTREKAQKAFEILSEYDTNVTVRKRGKSYIDKQKFNDGAREHYRISEQYQNFIYEYILPVSDFESFCFSLDSVEMICVFFHDQAELEECRARFAAMDGYGLAASEPSNIEIFDACAGKGSALLRLAKELGIDPSQTIAVGDSPNDLDMLTKAGLGLAMQNASDEVRACADAVVCHCDEHVVRYICDTYIK